METQPDTPDPAKGRYRKERVIHWDGIAESKRKWTVLRQSYQERMVSVYRHLISPGERVLEIGCGQGDLLAAVKPSRGVGIDISEKAVCLARERHPDLEFITTDVHELTIEGTFDIIILCDVVNDLWDVQSALEQVRKVSHPRTRLILNFYSRVWEWPVALGAKAGLVTSTLDQNWLTREDVGGLLDLAHWEPIRAWQEILWPLPLFWLEYFLNRFLVKLWPFKIFALQNFMVARRAAGRASCGGGCNGLSYRCGKKRAREHCDHSG